MSRVLIEAAGPPTNLVAFAQDDHAILRSRSDLDALDQMLDQQQRQFTDQVHSNSETLDPAIPVTFTKVCAYAHSSFMLFLRPVRQLDLPSFGDIDLFAAFWFKQRNLIEEFVVKCLF